MNFIAKIVGKNIRARREAAGLSQSALSKIAKISNVTISRIEAGTQAPQAISIAMIAEALGCTVEDLYIDPDAKTKPVDITPDDVIALIAAYRDATPERRAFCLAILTGDPKWMRRVPDDLIHMLEERLKAT